MIKGIKKIISDIFVEAGYGSNEKALRRYTCVECFACAAVVDHQRDKIDFFDKSVNKESHQYISLDTFCTMDRSRMVLSSDGEVFGYDPRIGLVGSKNTMIPFRLEDDEIFAVSKSFVAVYKLKSQLVWFYSKELQKTSGYPVQMTQVHIESLVDVFFSRLEEINHIEYDEDKSIFSMVHLYRGERKAEVVFPFRRYLQNISVVVNYNPNNLPLKKT